MEKKKIIAVMTCLVNELGECYDDQIVAACDSYAKGKEILEEDVFDTLARSGRKWEVEVIRNNDDYQVIIHLVGEGEPMLTRWYYLEEVNYYYKEESK